jgi:hypothetical protein
MHVCRVQVVEKGCTGLTWVTGASDNIIYLIQVPARAVAHPIVPHHQAVNKTKILQVFMVHVK